MVYSAEKFQFKELDHNNFGSDLEISLNDSCVMNF